MKHLHISFKKKLFFHKSTKDKKLLDKNTYLTIIKKIKKIKEHKPGHDPPL